MARLIGPTVAGLLIAITSEGWCFLIDGISYIAVLASLLAMRIDDSVHAQKKTSALTELREGWNYVTGFVPIRTIFVLFTVCSLMGMPFVVLMPVFAAQVLHGGPHTLGILMGAMGIGTLTSAISLAVRKSVRGLVTILPIAAIVFGLGLIGFGLSRWLWLSMLTVMIAGLGMMQGLAASNTVMQTLVPEEMRSRLMSYYTMAFIGMAPFGSLLAGTMAHRLGTPLTVILNGAAVIVGALWFFTQLHEVHRQVRPIYQRLRSYKIAEAISSSDSTFSAPPSLIASLGMPKTTQLFSSCAMLRAPACFISSMPRAPSSPMPVRITPTALRPA
jgi:MFS family permease